LLAVFDVGLTAAGLFGLGARGFDGWRLDGGGGSLAGAVGLDERPDASALEAVGGSDSVPRCIERGLDGSENRHVYWRCEVRDAERRMTGFRGELVRQGKWLGVWSAPRPFV